MKTPSIKRVVKKALGYFPGKSLALRTMLSSGLTAFAFHDVTDRPSRFCQEHDLAVSQNVFRRQISWIAENYEVVHPRTLLDGAVLPSRAAVLTFDDGHIGTFMYGLPILQVMQLPCVVFLNMRAVMEGTPIMSAVACYLEKYDPRFGDFARSMALSRPFHLTVSPRIMSTFIDQYGPIDMNAVLDYQGQFADMSLVRRWDDADFVVYGNHLFEHWNAPALVIEDFQREYSANEEALSHLTNSINLFAFTNGQPGTCFSTRETQALRRYGAARIFSAVGGVNRDSAQFLLGRLSFNQNDVTDSDLWFQITRARFQNHLGRHAPVA